MFTVPEAILVDARNFDTLKDRIIAEIQGAHFVGLDTETQDDARHEGLNVLCGYDPKTRKKAPGKKLVFDFRRTVMTGFSIYAEGSDTAWYINLNHADVENRVAWKDARVLIDCLPETSHWVAHNAAYELTVFQACYKTPAPHHRYAADGRECLRA